MRHYLVRSASLGADDEPQLQMTGVEQQTRILKQRMIETATTQAVVQMGTSLAVDTAFAAGGAAFGAAAAVGMSAAAAASVVPIVGWAVAALLVVGNLIGSHVAKKRMKEVLNDAKMKIEQYGAQTTATISEAKSRVGEEEFPVAEKLAASNAALDGLDGWFSKKKILHALSVAHVKPVQYAVKGVLRTGQIGARLVGDKKGAEKAKRWEEHWDQNSKRMEGLMADKLSNPYRAFAQDLDHVGRTFGGQEGVHVMRQRAGKLVEAAKHDMDVYRDAMLAKISSAEYRDATRTNIAKGLRNDPGFAARATELQARDRMLESGFSSSVQVPATTDLVQGKPVGTSNATSLLSTAAAIGAFFWLKS